MVICPEHAIVEGKREIGRIESGRSGKINFSHGILRVGEAMSPPLIKKLRKQQPLNGQTTIIDAPPGTSCPVIAAIKDADYILLVTEPTPFGLHDLILAHKTAMQLGVPCGLVINRADLGDTKVQEYAGKNNLPVLLEIPFDRKIAEIYSRGLMMITEMEEWKRPFKKLYADIVMQVKRGDNRQ
jgi:MinD superfamily P-loop ATPase